MQASLTFRRFAIQPLVIAMVALAVLILGATGGYWLRSQTESAVTRVVVAAPQIPVTQAPQNLRGSSQGLFGTANNGAGSSAGPDESSHQLGAATSGGSVAPDESTHRARIQY